MNVFLIENEIKNCKTAKQVYNLLKKHGIKIYSDDTHKWEGMGSGDVAKSKIIDILLDKQTRIYYKSNTGQYTIQQWNEYKTVIVGKERVAQCVFDDGKVHYTWVNATKDTLIEYRGKHKNIKNGGKE